MRRRPVPAILLLTFLAVASCAALRRERAAWGGLGLRDAPPRAAAARNPFDGDPEAIAAGAKLVRRYCTHCHGVAEDRGRAPSLHTERVRRAPAGALFWFITNGSLRDGMPSWSRLPAAQRWQIVTCLTSNRARP
jgi:mono/diheme cytochrome c family protein